MVGLPLSSLSFGSTPNLNVFVVVTFTSATVCHRSGTRKPGFISSPIPVRIPVGIPVSIPVVSLHGARAETGLYCWLAEPSGQANDISNWPARCRAPKDQKRPALLSKKHGEADATIKKKMAVQKLLVWEEFGNNLKVVMRL